MRSKFQKWICERKTLWVALLAFTLIHLVLAVLATKGIQRGTASYFVLAIDFVFIAFLLVVVALVFWRCGYLNDERPNY